MSRIMSSQVPSFGKIMRTSVAFAVRGIGEASSDVTGATRAGGILSTEATEVMLFIQGRRVRKEPQTLWYHADTKLDDFGRARFGHRPASLMSRFTPH